MWFTIVWFVMAWVVTWPVLYKTMYRFSSSWGDSDRVFGVIWGLFACAFFWPAIWIVMILIWTIKRGSIVNLLKRLEK